MKEADYAFQRKCFVNGEEFLEQYKYKAAVSYTRSVHECIYFSHGNVTNFSLYIIIM